MSRIYEGMFLIDNDAVRAGWTKAKATVSDLLKKHGGQLHCSRRWDERRLAYPIRKKNRATYLLAYFEIPTTSISDFHRELDLSEVVLRYLMTRSEEEIPAKERELALAEEANDFAVPEPPPDGYMPEPEPEPRYRRPAPPRTESETEKPKEEAKPEGAKTEATESEKAPAATEPVLASGESEAKKED